MRVSTFFISSTFVLAGMSAAFPVETEDMLVARFADSDFISEVEARAYDEGPGLYVHGGAISTNNYKTLSSSRHRRSFYEPPRSELNRRHDRDPHTPPPRGVAWSADTVDTPDTPRRPLTPWPHSPNSPNGDGNGRDHSYRHRPRSFDEPPRSALKDPHEPETPPKRVTWSPDTVDTPDTPRRPPTPGRHSPSSPRYRHRPRSFFDLD